MEKITVNFSKDLDPTTGIAASLVIEVGGSTYVVPNYEGALLDFLEDHFGIHVTGISNMEVEPG